MKVQSARITPLVLFAIALCLLFTAPAMANPNATGDNTDTSLLVDAEYVRRYKRQNPGLQVVDVRSSRAFEETHIPGSLHVPLGLVPHKESLQSNPVVLLGSGAEPGPLLRVCRKLRHKGVQASFLWGGIVRWREAGGRLTGGLKNQSPHNEISPAAYYRQRERDYWRVIYVGEKRPPDLETVMPGARFLHQDELASQLEKSTDPKLTLLVSRKGKGYDRLESALRSKGIANVLCLRGGLLGYADHIRARRNIEKKEPNQAATRSKCPSNVKGQSADICTECGE